MGGGGGGLLGAIFGKPEEPDVPDPPKEDPEKELEEARRRADRRRRKILGKSGFQNTIFSDQSGPQSGAPKGGSTLIGS